MSPVPYCILCSCDIFSKSNELTPELYRARQDADVRFYETIQPRPDMNAVISPPRRWQTGFYIIKGF